MYLTTDDTLAGRKGKKADAQMLSNILAACPVGLCRVERRRFKWVNRAMVKMFGYRSEKDLVNKGTRILYASDEEYERVGAWLYTSTRQQTEFETDAKLIRKNGAIFEGHIRISAPDPSNLMKGTIAAITDRTPLKEAEAALIESERRFRGILEGVRLVAFCLDTTGNITFCNDFLLEITGWQREEVLGRNWFDIFVPANDGEIQRHFHTSPAFEGDGIRHNRERHLLTKEGGVRCIRWNTTIFLRDRLGNVMGLAGIGEDITERKRANELLLRTERLKAVGDMAAGVAHNFNNFLQIVTAGSQVALQHLESGNIDQVQAMVEQISRTGSLAAETTRRLLDFSRSGDETTATCSRVFDLSNTIRQVVEMTKPLWKTNPEKAGITISLAADLEDGCLVRGKENELFEVAVNLLKNATEACPEGGKIAMKVFKENDAVVLQVEDDGIGIHEANLEKVFQPFWTTKGFQGTGMGLSSSHGIVKRHSGEISVSGAEGKGATFSVRLPKAPKQADARTRTASKAPDANLRILAVDDDDTLLKTVSDGIRLYGQEVFTAKSGLEALAIFNERTVDVVVCDLGMEGMNGWELSEAIKRTCLQRGIPKLPFVLLTGWGEQVSKNSDDESGVDRIVCKPVSIFTLMETIREVLEDARIRSCTAARAAAKGSLGDLFFAEECS